MRGTYVVTGGRGARRSFEQTQLANPEGNRDDASRVIVEEMIQRTHFTGIRHLCYVDVFLS
jgi:hypothetical protein